jgi:hypothetical protein
LVMFVLSDLKVMIIMDWLPFGCKTIGSPKPIVN